VTLSSLTWANRLLGAALIFLTCLLIWLIATG
jgi:hypothetical protein